MLDVWDSKSVNDTPGKNQEEYPQNKIDTRI